MIRGMKVVLVVVGAIHVALLDWANMIALDENMSDLQRSAPRNADAGE